MSQEAQKIAVPAVLRKRLQVYRVGQGKETHYLLTDTQEGNSYRFEPWQFFILEVLPGCEDVEKLTSVFEDRFGHSISNMEMEKLFSQVLEKKLFSLTAEANPILASFNKKRMVLIDGKGDNAGKPKSGAKSSAQDPLPEKDAAAAKKPPEKNSESDGVPLPAGVRDAIGLDDTMRNKGWKLFNPTFLIKLLQPLLFPLRYLIILLPVLLIAALFISIQHSPLIEKDLILIRDGASLLEHVLYSMLTVNLSVTLITALVAYTYRASISAFCIIFILGFFPRFMVRIGHVKQLTRRERIWLHAAPLLLRIGLFSSGMILWFNTRSMNNALPHYGLSIAFISAVSFFLTVNPVVKSNGYHLLSAFLNEPLLKQKAHKGLLNKLRRNVYQKTDKNVLIAYALASAFFMMVTIGIFLALLDQFVQIYVGEAGILVLGLVCLLILLRMIAKFKEVDLAYERSVQFERWRNRTVPKTESTVVGEKKQSTVAACIQVSLFLILLILMFLPYTHEPGGHFVILPNQKQSITTDISGIIEEIHFDGGEFIEKGTLIGRLAHEDYAAQMKIYTAKMQEQTAIINELKSRPRTEEVRLAERALETEKTRAKFSKTKLERLEEQYRQKTISFEDLDEMRREHEIDIDQVKEKQAKLELVKSGASSDEIAAAEAKLLSWQEEREYYQEKIRQSYFYMPFDGRLVTLHLKQKIGSYLNKGEPLSVAENTEAVVAEIKVPETDIGYVSESAKLRGRVFADFDNEVYGVVDTIDSTVTEEPYGKVVKVISLLDNQEGRLKPGMTGHAKITSETMPVWKVLSLSVIRFVKVEVWSWLP